MSLRRQPLDSTAVARPAGSLQLRTLRAYQVCDTLSGVLLCGMAVFSPWALGGTVRWAVWGMNLAAYALGGLWLVKLGIRWWTGYQPARWDGNESTLGGLAAADCLPSSTNAIEPALAETTGGQPAGRRKMAVVGQWLPRALGAVTLLVLAYCLVSGLNARATYSVKQLSFEYHAFIPWLPHSYDRAATLAWFWSYLGLACGFWAGRDWLLGMTVAEQRAARAGTLRPVGVGMILPARLRLLLWVLSLNGLVLGVEGIAQRLSGTNKLLWVVETRLNRDASLQFGPYAYRSNAAQYFNLLWPVTLGFWWTRHRAARAGRRRMHPRRGGRHHWLWLCVLVMAACPILSLSRAGAVIALGQAVLAAMILLLGARTMPGSVKFALSLVLLLAAGLGLFVSGEQLESRLAQFADSLEQRERLYAVGRQMAQDFPWWGSGPGTLNALFQMYRSGADDYWPAQLHNDWVETRVTFGRVGSGLIGLAFALLAARWFLPGGLAGSRRFVLLIWLAFAGCLVHARVDFPFQIHSLLFLFVLLSAVLFLYSRPQTR